MQDAFGIVIFGVVVVAVLIAVATLLSSRAAYDEIGKGGLFDGSDRPLRETPAGLSASAVRDDEIRQMLQARNARRERRGEAPLDVEAELAALSRPAIDAALIGEIRDLVEARNARRERQGRPPLDVEAEIERQIRDLT